MPTGYVFPICTRVDGLWSIHGKVSQAFVHWSHLHGTTTPSQFPGHSNNGWNMCSPRMLSGSLLQTRRMVSH